jgi:tetratricopeptide (TPR) repeat protein
MSARAYKYDAALSFAGEDRKLAESLFHSLKQRGLSVFYDADRETHLWGKTSKTFERIYGPESRYVIPLVSKHYIRKAWTRFEFDTALLEQEKRRAEFILPVRLDDSRLLGLPNDVIRQDARKKSADELAELFMAKCRRVRRHDLPSKEGGVRNVTLSLLKPDARQALGVIAAAVVPLPRAQFEELFPQYDWRRLVSRFRRAGFVQADPILLGLNRPTLRALRDDVEHRKSLNLEWINRLSPLAAHVDAAAFLSVHFLVAGRFEEAARTAVNIAQYTNLGWWNQIYVTILSALARPRSFAKLGRQMQVELLNSLGTCLSQAGQYREAMRRFGQLRLLSKRHRNTWGIGQAFINAGVTASKSGDVVAAERLFSSAAEHGKESRDQMLRGRALSNLSQLYLNKDIDYAERLLAESLRAKAAAKDSTGLVAGLITRGNLSATRGNFQLAARLYEQSTRAALKLGLRYEQALSTYNHGRALQDAGKLRSAMAFYVKALKLATPDDYTDVSLLALTALGAGAFALGRYRTAHEFGRKLLVIAKRTENQKYQASALHMLAMASLAGKRLRKSNQEFRAAIRAARKRDAVAWVARCLIDSTRRARKDGVGNPDLVRLRQIARMEASRRQYRIAAELWQRIARMTESGKADQGASDAFIAAEKCLLRSRKFVSERLDLYRNWFAWAWGLRRCAEGLLVLSRLETLARKSNATGDAIAAMDQRGVCLQELGEYAKAEALHRAAAAAAKHIKDNGEQEERSLNNLGEALRCLGRYHDAVHALKDSEKIAQRARRYDSAISTAHNRALALGLLGRPKESERVLRRCRDQAEHLGLWYEYVRAWEALANLTWAAGKPTAALRLYVRAQRESRTRQIGELAPRIALNFARLLRTQNRLKAAIRALEPFRSRFQTFIDAYQYFGTLADLYDETSRMKEAATTWNTARVSADNIGNQEYASYCAAKESRSLAKLGKARLSQRALVSALKTEGDPARRVNLLIQRVELLITKRSKDAQAAFDEALRVCTQNNLHKQRLELCLLVGDHNLSRKYDAKLSAFKAYTIALMSALAGDMTEFGKVASHIVFKIASANSTVREDEVEHLLHDLKKHLTAESPDAKRIIKFLVWPFELAVQLFPFRKHPHRFLAAARELASVKNIAHYLAPVKATGSLTTQRSG